MAYAQIPIRVYLGIADDDPEPLVEIAVPIKMQPLYYGGNLTVDFDVRALRDAIGEAITEKFATTATAICNFPACSARATSSGRCGQHEAARIASSWSAAGEDEGHRKGGEE